MALRFLNDGYFAGKVGIGINSPAATLHVYNEFGGNATTKATMLSEAVLKLQPHTTNSTNLLVAQVNNGGGIGLQVTNGPATANWDVVLSPFGGKVGIGIDAPAAELDIASTTPTIRLTNTDDSLILNQILGEIDFYQSDPSDQGIGVVSKINCINEGTFAGLGALAFQTGTATSITERVRIDGSGKVGINTTSPDQLLDVSRTATTFSGASADEGAVIRISNPSNWESGYDGGGFIGGIEFHSGDASEAGPGVFGAIKQRQLTYYNTQAMCFFTRHYNGSLTERLRISSQGAIQFNSYGNGVLVTDASGNITATTSPPVDGITFNNGATITNQINTDVDTGTETIASVAIATHDSAFFDFVIKKTTNVRSGTVYACHDGAGTPLVAFTETSTQDLGDTSDVTLSVDISGTNMELQATTTSDNWSIKSLIRAI